MSELDIQHLGTDAEKIKCLCDRVAWLRDHINWMHPDWLRSAQKVRDLFEENMQLREDIQAKDIRIARLESIIGVQG